MASDPDMHAKVRICETIMGKISKTKASSKNGARVVGLHGTGGIGKTSFCKELCYQYHKEFEGKVFNAELGRQSKRALQEQVVGQFTNVNNQSLHSAQDTKVVEHLRKRMAKNKVFLALDNVWQESIEEAEVHVQHARYGRVSIVLVTARSVDILELLQINKNDCLEMPELDTKDARQLFLYHAAPGFQSQSDEDEKRIQCCINQCRFSKGGYRQDVHFHPLALKVFGAQMKRIERSPKKWVETLSKGDKFNKDRMKEHPLFVVLGIGYDHLGREDQLLFMDVALTNPGWIGLETMTLYEWLSIVHGTASNISIKTRLEVLKARALVEVIDVGRVIVHDLYREFAKFVANRGNLQDKLLVWPCAEEATNFLRELVKTPPGGPNGCRSNVERFGIEGAELRPRWSGRVEGIKWQHFANVVVLVLELHVDHVFDLRGLRCLRSLTLKAHRSRVIGLGELRNLGWLDLAVVFCTLGLQEIGLLTELQVLRVKRFCTYHDYCGDVDCRSGNLQHWDFQNLNKCINLRELKVWCSRLKALRKVTSLRKAFFGCERRSNWLDWDIFSPPPDLHFLALHVGPRLGEAVTSLQVLVIEYCDNVLVNSIGFCVYLLYIGCILSHSTVPSHNLFCT